MKFSILAATALFTAPVADAQFFFFKEQFNDEVRGRLRYVDTWMMGWLERYVDTFEV